MRLALEKALNAGNMPLAVDIITQFQGRGIPIQVQCQDESATSRSSYKSISEVNSCRPLIRTNEVFAATDFDQSLEKDDISEISTDTLRVDSQRPVILPPPVEWNRAKNVTMKEFTSIRSQQSYESSFDYGTLK